MDITSLRSQLLVAQITLQEVTNEIAGLENQIAESEKAQGKQMLLAGTVRAVKLSDLRPGMQMLDGEELCEVRHVYRQRVKGTATVSLVNGHAYQFSGGMGKTVFVGK